MNIQSRVLNDELSTSRTNSDCWVVSVQIPVLVLDLPYRTISQFDDLIVVPKEWSWTEDGRAVTSVCIGDALQDTNEEHEVQPAGFAQDSFRPYIAVNTRWT